MIDAVLTLPPVEIVEPAPQVEVDLFDFRVQDIDVDTEIELDYDAEKENFSILSELTYDDSEWHVFVSVDGEGLALLPDTIGHYEEKTVEDLSVGISRGPISIGWLNKKEKYRDRNYKVTDHDDYVYVRYRTTW